MQHDKTHTSWQNPCGMSFAMPWPLPWWYSKTHASDTLLWHEFCHAMTFPMDAIGFQEFSDRPAFGTVHCNEKLALTVLHQLHCNKYTEIITLQQLHNTMCYTLHYKSIVQHILKQNLCYDTCRRAPTFHGQSEVKFSFRYGNITEAQNSLGNIS